MEFYEVKPAAHPLKCKMEVPGSKSVTNRALLLAALADGVTTLKGVLYSDDAHYFLESLKTLGFAVEDDPDTCTVRLTGAGGRVPEKEAEIYVGSAGTAARFLTAYLGVSDGTYTIRASEQMAKRPMQPLFDVLEQLGAQITWLGREGFLPVTIRGAAVTNRQDACEIQLDISRSTQFLSAFLLIAPLFRGGLKIRIGSSKKDGAYVRITRQMMASFGVEARQDVQGYETAPGTALRTPGVYEIEPDMSAACYFYAAAALLGGTMIVERVHPDMMQGDLKFLEVLSKMGCRYRDTKEGIILQGPADGQLAGISLNMNDFSDQALTLAAIAPYASGPVEIAGIAHIRGQECDRIRAMEENLTAAGIRCKSYDDGIRIEPGTPHACRIRTFDDHRVAMAFSLLGLKTEGICIENPLCCRKTFPDYFEKFERLYE